MKNVVVLVRRAPLNALVTAEALRVALGQTLADHRVTVLYLDAGAGAAAPLQPELIGGAPVGESLELFGPTGVRQVADGASLKQARVDRTRPEVEVVERPAALALLAEADVVFTF